MTRVVAWHFTDPGCPWAYSSRPAMLRLRWRFGDQLDWRPVMIGLAETAADYERRGYTPTKIATRWPTYARRFGMPFAPGVIKSHVAGTAPGCRAVVAAREADPDRGYEALRALQLMQFTTAGLLDSPDDIRAALATVPDLDADAIVARLDDPTVTAAYEEDRARARGAAGRPIHVQDRHAETDGPVRYTAPSVIFEHPDGGSLEVGGFQPFESYDTALANLDPGLERRPPPAAVADVVDHFEIGVTTAEVAAVMRGSELDEFDIPGTQRALIEAAAEGAVFAEPAGTSTIWRPAAG